MLNKKPLELLAPAGSADIGIAAIDHGADAVYVGAPRFSARANAGVAMDEMARLIRHAHLYYAKVYVALNTILTDEEFPEALDQISRVYELGADGLIIQDLGLLEMDLPPIPLIASTQMHNDTPGKIQFLEDVGFKRAILARELSLPEIAEIRRHSKIELECFVHGALCVSYSGQCYMSHAITGRSANRGVCAQPCRSRYTLMDGDGKAVIPNRFLLSLKDLNLLHDIPDLAAAGVTSFKIEGRYKEIDYVQNVTAAYRHALDAFIADHPEFCRSSSGHGVPAFAPDPAKSFNRGFSRYFLRGGEDKIASLSTPKSIGQLLGPIKRLDRESFQIDGSDLQNGDGLCFFTSEGELAGFRVEGIEKGRIYPSSMKGLTKGVPLYRNHNSALIRQLQKAPGPRRISVEADFTQTADLIRLEVRDEDGNNAEWSSSAPYVKPRDPLMAKEMVEKHIRSTGNTPFRITELRMEGQLGFLAAAMLNQCRRQALEKLLQIRYERYPREARPLVPNRVPYPLKKLDFHGNVLNGNARSFYARHGTEILEPAFESLPEFAKKEVMRTRYCLRRELDACLKAKDARQIRAPLRIVDAHHSYLLEFDCTACKMSVVFLGRK